MRATLGATGLGGRKGVGATVGGLTGAGATLGGLTVARATGLGGFALRATVVRAIVGLFGFGAHRFID